MAFGKKKESREVEGYMKLTPKSARIYLVIIVFCIVVISPLVIVFSSSLRSPGNQASPLILFSEFTLASYKQAFRNMNYPMELINSILTTGGSVLRSDLFYHGSISDRTYQNKNGKIFVLLLYFRSDHSISDGNCSNRTDSEQTGYPEYPFYTDDHVHHLFASVLRIPVFRIYERCSG